MLDGDKAHRRMNVMLVHANDTMVEVTLLHWGGSGMSRWWYWVLVGG